MHSSAWQQAVVHARALVFLQLPGCIVLRCDASKNYTIPGGCVARGCVALGVVQHYVVVHCLAEHSS